MLKKWDKHKKPILDIGSPGTFDSVLVCIPSVLKEDDHYKMWYTAHGGVEFRVGLAISKDGVNFTKYEKNPVLDVTSDNWDCKGVQFAQVIKENDIYKMWYAGYNEKRIQRIGFAISNDGMAWTKEPAPVLDIGQEDRFDQNLLLKPSVIRDGNGYRMVYAALSSNRVMSLGLATSGDGKEWEKYSGNPIIEPEPGKWDCNHIEDPHLIKLDKYYLTYAGKDDKGHYRIGLAVSTDGMHYKKVPEPILDIGSETSFESTYVAGNYLFCDPPNIIMYYHGRDSEKKERINFARCCDLPEGFLS